jgi:hypothetical protein
MFLQRLKGIPASQVINAQIDAWGGRRFLITLGCGISTSFLVWHAKITPEVFRDITIATVAVYIAGNTYQKREQIKATGTSEEPVIPSTSTSIIETTQKELK